MSIESFAVTMDNLGFMAFLYVTIYSIIKLKKTKKKDTLTIILLLVGIAGMIVDGSIIVWHYLN